MPKKPHRRQQTTAVLTRMTPLEREYIEIGVAEQTRRLLAKGKKPMRLAPFLRLGARRWARELLNGTSFLDYKRMDGISRTGLRIAKQGGREVANSGAPFPAEIQDLLCRVRDRLEGGAAPVTVQELEIVRSSLGQMRSALVERGREFASNEFVEFRKYFKSEIGPRLSQGEGPTPGQRRKLYRLLQDLLAAASMDPAPTRKR